MARLIILLAFALVASLCSPTDASWFRSKAKRADLDEACPTCGGPPPQFNHGSWGDWSMTTSSPTPPSYVPESSATTSLSAPVSVVPSFALTTVIVSDTDTFITTVWVSGSASTDSVPSNTVTSSENMSSSSEATTSSAAFASSTSDTALLTTSSSTSDSTSATSSNSTPTAAETFTSSSESFASSSLSGQSTSVASATSSSTAAVSSTLTSESVTSSSLVGEPSASSNSSSASNGQFSGTTSETSTSGATPASSSSGTGSDSSTETSSSQSTASSSQPTESSESQASSASDSSAVSTTSQSSEAATSSQPSFAAGSSESQSNSSPSASAETVLSSTETTESLTSFSTTISQESTTFVTVVKSTILSVQVESSTVSSAPGLPLSGSTNSSAIAVGGIPVTPFTQTPDVSTGTCTDDACTDVSTITYPPDASVPIFEPELSTSALSTLSLFGPPPVCSYSYRVNSLLPFYSYYTLDPWCWTHPISLLGFGDASTTTINSLGLVVAERSAYCVCPLCWLGSDNLCYLYQPSSGNCAEGWWCTVTADSSTVARALPSGICPDNKTALPWDSTTGCPFTNKGEKSTSSVSFTATLSHSTKPIAGGYIDFPSWQWECRGPLCKDSCGNLIKVAGEIIKCILSAFTKCKVCHGKFGFPFPPPVPPIPPIPDPPHVSFTLPTTHCTDTAICTPGVSDASATASGNGQSNTPTSAQSSGSSETFTSSSSFETSSLSSSFETSSMSSSSETSRSSSSCSSTTFPSCFEVVSNSNVTLSGSTITSLTTSTSCTTITACTGTSTTTVTTLNSSTAAACTLSPWWNDPSISAQIALWITQFPPISDNGTFFTAANTTQVPVVANATSSLTSTSDTSATVSTASNTSTNTTLSSLPTIFTSSGTGSASGGSTTSLIVLTGSATTNTPLKSSTSLISSTGSAASSTSITNSTISSITSSATSGDLSMSSIASSEFSSVSTSEKTSTIETTTTSRSQTSVIPGPLPACGPFTFGSEGCTSITTPPALTSTHQYSTITSSATYGSKVWVYTCPGLSAPGTVTCANSWSLETIITTTIATPPEVARTSSCVAWTAPISTTASPSHKALDCATPVSGKATSTLQTWKTGMPISPFDTDNGDASPPAVFCNRLEDGNIIIVSDVLESLDTPNWPYSRGECQGFYGEKMTKLGYNITIQLVYDSAGCDNNDKYATGINMTDYGWKNCRDVFHDKILNNCQFSDKTTDHLGLGDSNMVGGVYWQDCMRWTIISVKDDLSQIDTSPFT